jgi:transposase
VHGYHARWSRDGTWEAVVDRLREFVREREGCGPEPSAGKRAAPKSSRLTKIWHDAGFKRTFTEFCRDHKIKADLVFRKNAYTFEVLPRRWVVGRTWGWLVHQRRL